MTTATRSTVAPAQASLSSQAANGLLYLSAFTASWTAVAVAGNNVVDYLLIGALGMMLVAWAIAKRPVYVSVWMLLPFVASLVVVASATIFGGAASGEAEMLFRVLLSTAGVAVLLTSAGSSGGSRVLGRALRWWAAGIVVCAAAAAATSLGLISFAGVLIQPTGDRLSGLSSHPNSLAFSITLALPVLVYLAHNARGFWRTGWWISLLAVAVWGLALTGSRSGLLVGVPMLGLAVILALRGSRLRLLSVPLVILGAIAAWIYLPRIFQDTRLVQGAVDSDTGRTIINDGALETFAANPFVGGGFDAQVGVAVPLMVLSGGGIILAIGYYLYVLWPLPTLWRGRSDRLAQTGLLVLAAFIAFGFLNPVFVERATFWPILIPALWMLVDRARETATNPWKAPATPPTR